jgi:hypothetical protein
MDMHKDSLVANRLVISRFLKKSIFRFGINPSFELIYSLHSMEVHWKTPNTIDIPALLLAITKQKLVLHSLLPLTIFQFHSPNKTCKKLACTGN